MHDDVRPKHIGLIITAYSCLDFVINLLAIYLLSFAYLYYKQNGHVIKKARYSK